MGIATTSETLSGGDYTWLATGYDVQNVVSGTLDVSGFTISNGYIPSGTPVKLVTQTGLYTAASTTSTSATLAGFVLHDTAAATDDVPFALLTDARIDASEVPGTHDLEDGRYICSADAIASAAT